MPKNNKDEAHVRHSTLGPWVTAVVSLATTLIFALSRLAGATTVNANSASQSDVAAAIASAADGDTITIPGGTASWTRTLQVRRGITIQGAGVGVTIIRDNVQSGQLIRWTLAEGLPSRLTGIEFQDGGRINTITAPGGILHVDGSNTNGSTFRWDHCKWNNLNGPPVFDTVIGVIDHNTFVRTDKSYTIIIYGSRWDGGSLGDGSWHAPTGYGSSQWLFIEDNDIINNGTWSACTDAYGGARFVVRHNTMFNSPPGNHGTESTGRERGARAMEVYNNTYTGNNQNNLLGGSRSGGVLFHDNSVSGYGGNIGSFSLQNYRNFMIFPTWGGADGTNTWDVNEPNAFFTGTAAANSSGTTVIVSGVNWTTNQWVGYTLRRLTNVCGSNSVTFGWIRSNTANTITYTDNGGYNIPTTMAICAGDSLEIRKVDHAIDQDGRALGSLITGDPPVRPPNWNDQVTEPCYSWNNINENNVHLNFYTSNGYGGPGIKQNVHFFNDTPMPGYTPYTYPHPLTKSLPASQPTGSATPGSQSYLNKRNERKAKKVKRWKWGRAKENSGKETTEPVAPDY
jgi:hypothetical protein